LIWKRLLGVQIVSRPLYEVHSRCLNKGTRRRFLARYRRDELGGLSEQAMWTLYRAMRDEAWIKNRREDLAQVLSKCRKRTLH
jgi:transcriptional accessory protein Tex/SPT6